MDIACNIDSNYIKYCVVMLVSLFENNKGESFNIHIIGDDLTFQDKEIIKDNLYNYGNEIVFYDVSANLLKNYPLSDNSHISLSTYYRILLPNILPTTIHKIIYLDCDIIIRHSIKELWDIDIENHAIGCVEDMWSGQKDNYIRLHYDSSYSYFNAGVLLINLSYWRDNKISERSVNYVKQYPERLKFNDQDVLNAILHTQKKFISYKWNMQDGFYRRTRYIRKDVWKEIDSFLNDPALVHFTGDKKPWLSNCRHPLRKEWFKYIDKTQWAGERPKVYWKREIGHYFFQLGVWMKIDKPKFRKLKKS